MPGLGRQFLLQGRVHWWAMLHTCVISTILAALPNTPYTCCTQSWTTGRHIVGFVKWICVRRKTPVDIFKSNLVLLISGLSFCAPRVKFPFHVSLVAQTWREASVCSWILWHGNLSLCNPDKDKPQRQANLLKYWSADRGLPSVVCNSKNHHPFSLLPRMLFWWLCFVKGWHWRKESE